MSTDVEWERWGAEDPYFGVLTNPKFRADTMTAESANEFFVSGHAHVDYVLNTCREHLVPEFQPKTVLDFGCGVGRLLIPFAHSAQHVVGLDISASMLAEARRNCDMRSIHNVTLSMSDDSLSAAIGPYDLVHSCIVLQHIETKRGRGLFQLLVDRVQPGGVGAIHVTFALDTYAHTFGQKPPPQPPEVLSARQRVKAQLRQLLESCGVLKPAPPVAVPADPDPEMQMNYYNLSELFFILQQARVSQVHTELTDHGGALGAFLFFRRS